MPGRHVDDQPLKVPLATRSKAFAMIAWCLPEINPGHIRIELVRLNSDKPLILQFMDDPVNVRLTLHSQAFGNDGV
jgi:hypothetical protein